MKIEDVVRQVAEKNHQFKTADVLSAFDTKQQPARTYVSSVINNMVRKGLLLKSGTGRWSVYALPKNAEYLIAHSTVSMRLVNKSLKEHEILEEIKEKASFFPKFKRNVQDIFNYSFSEMLNNAIEHSSSKSVQVSLTKDKDKLVFAISDVGIGVFNSIMTKKLLDTELDAIRELLKGKTTTSPQAHSGEGIFFTSKMADVFILDSFGYRLRIDNVLKDIFIEELKPSKKGTRVTFEIAAKTNRHTSDIFRQYVTDPETLAFDKTEILIKLYTMGTVHVSRSQARRLLSGLNKFKNVVLDFDQVPTIGQGFADEIFRVFQLRHPDIIIEAINSNEAVKFMIDRVETPTPQ